MARQDLQTQESTMNQPYNLHEQRASLTMGQAMSLQAYAIVCHSAGLNPVLQIKQLVEIIKRGAQQRCPSEQTAEIEAAYDRVFNDLLVNLGRFQLLKQSAMEEASEPE